MDESEAPNQTARTKQIVFLGGLPRTGSTALTSILTQNPDVHAETQSALPFLMFSTLTAIRGDAHENLIRTNRKQFEQELLPEIARLYYREVRQKIVIENMRGWTRDEANLRYFLTNNPRILILLRPITEIVKSFVYASRQPNSNISEYALLQTRDPLLLAIQNVAWALRQNTSEQLFGTYDQFLSDPQSFLDQVCFFWQIPKQKWDFDNLKANNAANDSELGMKGLHEIRRKLAKREYEVKFSPHLLKRAQELDEALWHDYEQAKSLRPNSFIF